MGLDTVAWGWTRRHTGGAPKALCSSRCALHAVLFTAVLFTAVLFTLCSSQLCSSQLCSSHSRRTPLPQEAEHCDRTDSKITFKSSNGLTANSKDEWEVAYEPDPEKVAAEAYVEREGFKEDHPEWCRQIKPVMDFEPDMERLNRPVDLPSISLARARPQPSSSGPN